MKTGRIFCRCSSTMFRLSGQCAYTAVSARCSACWSKSTIRTPQVDYHSDNRIAALGEIDVGESIGTGQRRRLVGRDHEACSARRVKRLDSSVDAGAMIDDHPVIGSKQQHQLLADRIQPARRQKSGAAGPRSAGNDRKADRLHGLHALVERELAGNDRVVIPLRHQSKLSVDIGRTKVAVE